MRLVAVEVTGFRRFASTQKLELDSGLTAIVGPNEAGKTSLLDAMLRLDDREAIAFGDRTRRLSVPDSQIVVSALFLVEEYDRAALEGLPGVDDKRRARWLQVDRTAGGRASTQLFEPLLRDTRPRKAAATWIRRAHRKAVWEIADLNEDDPRHSNQLEPLLESLDSLDETLPEQSLARLSALTDSLGDMSGPDAELGVAVLRKASEVEAGEHPNRTARTRLFRRTPDFLLFDEKQRDLRSDYDLAEVASEPPPPLRNLAGLAELDLEDLLVHIRRDASETVVELLENANARLGLAFSAWSQEAITVRFDRVDGTILRLHVSNPAGGYSKLEERSDGLKIFVALLALTSQRTRIPPIILIDELERHLHYDAQADVVQVFARQDALPQIVYTTHSAGCLPEDLGLGVRLVGPIPETNYSSVQNRFWTQGEGFSPLLVGMGAATLAFVPVRNAVMTEGASDIILLPTLLREATGQKSIGFQIAPASSEAPATRIGGLDAEGAPGVAWLVDGDEGGRALRRRLKRAGIPDERIVPLAGERSETVLEDLLRGRVYVEAFNEELRRSGQELELPADVVRGANRPRKAAMWCAKRKVKVPRKSDVAYRVLERRLGDEALLDARGREVLRDLHQRLDAIFRAEGAVRADLIS